jgi:hypothetical protein
MEGDGTISCRGQRRSGCYDKIIKEYWENPSARNSVPPSPLLDEHDLPGPNSLDFTHHSLAAALDAALDDSVETRPPVNPFTLNTYPLDVFDG